MKHYHDAHLLPTELPTLQSGQRIRVLDHTNKSWIPGKVVRRENTPRSYLIATNTGSILRRNRSQLRNTIDGSSEGNHRHANNDETQQTTPHKQVTFAIRNAIDSTNNAPSTQSTIQRNALTSKQPLPNRNSKYPTTRYGRQIRIPSRFKE